ncbi:alpha/beta fold hydrolase [Streptacidiphilus carbonis]|uniref:alpha/beta fold hydrolase n=1 Tax=Streptacidiphilus carbonis TaxID=105422 RepID=UPI0005A6F750|nr:alpha/beta fold hydrolase [Streptacidiphilus carbonis]
MGFSLLRPRRALFAGAAAAALLVGGGTWTAVAGHGPASVQRTDQVLALPEAPGSAATVKIDTSYFTSGSSDVRRPAVLLAHGFGGSKNDLTGEAQTLAREGYAVMTWSARGFGASGGDIGLNDPKAEVADVSGLIDWLAERPEVQLDAPGDPRVGVAGASYGGAVALLAAGYDKRVDAIAPEITYWNLSDALFPDGVFKKLWAGIFFTTGSTDQSAASSTSQSGPRITATDDATCGRFAPDLCAMYQRVAVSGKPDAAAEQLLAQRSPSAAATRIKVPTLLVQGQTDSLFPLDQADRAAAAIRANGAPVAVDWIAGGHDGGDMESSRIEQRTSAWFDRYLKRDTAADTGPAFRVSRSGGVDSTSGTVTLQGASADAYPGLEDSPEAVSLSGPPQTFANPPGGAPPAVSVVPGIGGLGQLSSLGVGLSVDFPGQSAEFSSQPLTRSLRITGSPTVRIHVRADSDDAVLFAKLYDVAPGTGGARVLPSQLVTPLRVTGARAGADVLVRLPAVDHQVAAGHRLELVLSSTDLAYASPAAPASYTVSLAGNDLSVPTDPVLSTAAAPLPWWVWALPLLALAIAAALLLTGRRRHWSGRPAADPELVLVPLRIQGLTKRYAGSADRYAVRDLSFQVEPGQVLGLLGPNGAGKTTTLRMLMGLIRPDEGEIRVFGQSVRPGAPVLSRVGAFVEGPGFLPHLSGLSNLELYWRATGRPDEEARLDEALAIAGLGDAVERAVRTYSQGMRQRLAIAQAMLGLPDLLILDEPLNGLDPPQIREMREVITGYAAGGRTVIVSSHLLAEVEQTCTHLVVMDHGQLAQAGPVADIVGSEDAVLVGTVLPLDADQLGKVAALPGVASAEQVADGLLVRLAGASAADLTADLVRLEIPVQSLGPHRRLEDAFLTLIGGAAR